MGNKTSSRHAKRFLEYSRKTRLKDKLLLALIWAAAAVTVLVLVGIIGYILVNGLPHVSWRFITDIYQAGGDKKGVLPMIINTLYMVVITIVIAVPVGICTAIYLTQYARQGRLVEAIRFATEILAGIPSIIYGLFGFAFFVVFLKMGYSIIAGCLTLSIMILPTIVRTTEESLKAVPVEYKEGAMALGAGKLRVITGIILPCAIPGVLTSVVLAMGRIVGESAALILTSGIAYRMANDVIGHISESGRTLTLHLYELAALGEPLEQSFATAAVLLVIVFLLNRLAGLTAKLFRKG